MSIGDHGTKFPPGSSYESRVSSRDPNGNGNGIVEAIPSVIVTEVSPFHCLYQDALEFHSQSRLMMTRSESASSRLARASFLLYMASAEALIHQAAVELGRPDLAGLIADPGRPMAAIEVWKLLPATIGVGMGSTIDFTMTPWPQMAELLALRLSWAYPGPPKARRAYYRASKTGAGFEPLQPHQVPKGLGVTTDALVYPRTGLPRDPYALRPLHLDTTRGVLDAVIESLDRKLDGALTRGNRHRREPIQVVQPPAI